MKAYTLFRTVLVAGALVGVVACEPGITSVGDVLPLAAAKRAGKLKPTDGGGGSDTTTVTAPEGARYELVLADDFDPLWRFTVSGESVRLETDPSIASWGSDYWGYWSDPFSLVDGVVHYVIGLTDTTYELAWQQDGLIDVSKTLIVTPYLGDGSPTVTRTHIGVFQLTTS